MNLIQKVRGIKTSDGAGAEPVRLFPTYRFTYIDPFIMLDYFSIQKPAGFPDHPHRGFEIITYVLEGAIEHKDNAGHAVVIGEGDLQRITAGRGIIHSEMPGTDTINRGLQLWINLPRSEKGIDPSYRDFKSDEIPVEQRNGVTIRTLVGENSPVDLRRPMVYYDIYMEDGTNFDALLPAGFQGFMYVLTGRGMFGDTQESAGEGDLLAFTGSSENSTIPIQGIDHLRFVFVAGEPIGERPRYNGPFVD